MQETQQIPPFFFEPFRCPSCRVIFATFKQLLDHRERTCYPDTGESGDMYDCELEALLDGRQVENSKEAKE